MSEQEIRRIIRSVCADLDQRARRAAQSTIRKAVLPTVVGVGLAVSGCSNEVIEQRGPIVPQTDGEAEDGASDAAAAADTGTAVPVYSAPLPDAGAVQPEYMAPAPDGALYMAPDAGAIQPEYMAPAPDGAVTTDAATSTDAAPYDAGPVIKYMAPRPDAGMVPLYGVPIYAAPSPNK